MKPFLVSPRALELYIEGDGQRFTDLIRSWANLYLRRCGATNFSINGLSWSPDGGVDGLINDALLIEPMRWLAPQTAMQFKAGATSVSGVKIELLAEPADGKERIRDKIGEGYKVVWFVGRALPDLQRQSFENALAETVKSINAKAPPPIVIDMNRLADLISLTPAVALSVASNHGLFITPDKALGDTPHSLLPSFIPGSNYAQLRQDVLDFFLGDAATVPIKYIAGEPGIGKTRCVLEAVESSDELRGTVCYFPDPTSVGQFIKLAKQEGWRGWAIIDEYIGESAQTTPIDGSTVPIGFKFLLIGHAYNTDRRSPRVERLEPLTEDEVKDALAATYPDLDEFRLREAVHMSRDNIRLARFICDYYRRNPNSPGLDADSLGQIVNDELDRMPHGQDVLRRLALLPNLLAEETSEFCRLVEYEEDSFRKTCRKVSRSSALIQFNEHVAYVASPAVAHFALMQFWNEDPELARRVLSSPGVFSERILTAINKLPACPEKEAMLAFFALPTAKLKLADLTDRGTGRRFLNLLTADPGTYLPVLHRLVMGERGRLDEFPYEGTDVGRRDIIWRVRDLAQFEECFELSEEIVYSLAREEAPSAYGGTASDYWASWFQAYFDHTTYPYEKRLDILERRALDGDEVDQGHVLRALAKPFPQVGVDVPASRVGGRLAPPELNFIHREQIQLAAQRIPGIVEVLLRSPFPSIVQKAVDLVLQSRFSWLEAGALDQYLQMAGSPEFPTEGRKQLVADTRHYVSLGSDRDSEPDERVKWIRQQHERLLHVIDDPDPFVTLLEVAGHGMWRGDQPGTAAHKKLVTLLDQCLGNPGLFAKAIEILGEPKIRGGAHFGRLLGAVVNGAQLKAILDRVREVGFSQFTHSALFAAARAEPDREAALRDFAAERESEQPQVAVSIFQLLGEEVYFREAARMLASSSVPSRLFGGFILRPSDDHSESVWSFVKAVYERTIAGDEEAGDVLAAIAGDFARNNTEDERAYAVSLTVLQSIPSDQSRNALAEWSDIALWAYRRFPDEVIRLAASGKHSEYSEATTTLAEIAKLDPEAVLDALGPKLRAPYESPFLFSGSLLRVMQNIPVDTFDQWLRRQDNDVLRSVAGHLPKPYMLDGRAVVPELTLKFWEVCVPELGDTYSKALSNFGAHTYNTGVYMGYGVDLFTERIEVGKQLRLDANPAIREWAERHQATSERMLADAVRSVRLDQAERATVD